MGGAFLLIAQWIGRSFTKVLTLQEIALQAGAQALRAAQYALLKLIFGWSDRNTPQKTKRNRPTEKLKRKEFILEKYEKGERNL